MFLTFTSDIIIITSMNDLYKRKTKIYLLLFTKVYTNKPY